MKKLLLWSAIFLSWMCCECAETVPDGNLDENVWGKAKEHADFQKQDGERCAKISSAECRTEIQCKDTIRTVKPHLEFPKSANASELYEIEAYNDNTNSQKSAERKNKMKIRVFFKTTDGKTVKLYSLRNTKKFQVDITDMGGAMVSIFTRDREGRLVDILRKHTNPADYEKNRTFYGALIGRVANRISKGELIIDGKKYQLPLNDHNRPNSLHGGLCYGRRLWNAEVIDETTLKLTLKSPDGDAGYPGNVDIEVIYHVTEENAIEISYRAVTDAPTCVNLTNHAYFNLNGTDAADCRTHKIWSKAYAHTEVDAALVPTGKNLPAAGTAYDLSNGRTFESICTDPALPAMYDDNFVIADKAGIMRKSVFKVISHRTGITLEVDTDQPGIQFYMVPERKSFNGYANAFCLEAQLWPDAPHHDNFPSAMLRPGEVYTQKTVYRFSVAK